MLIHCTNRLTVNILHLISTRVARARARAHVYVHGQGFVHRGAVNERED